MRRRHAFAEFGSDVTYELLGEKDLLRSLGLKKKLGCGGEGCVFRTNRGTVARLHSDLAVESPLNDALVAQMFIDWRGRHPAIPVVFNVGRLDDPFGYLTIFIEREELDDVPEVPGFFVDSDELKPTPLSKWIDGRIGDAEVREAARGNPIAEQVVDAFAWFKAQGVDPGDVDVARNWGMRKDGTVAVRDWSLFFIGGDRRPELLPYDLYGEGGSNEVLLDRFERLPVIHAGQFGGYGMARRYEKQQGTVADIGGWDVAYYDPENRHRGWPNDQRLTYEGTPKIEVVVPPYLGASDYSDNDGGLARANFNVFTENYSDLEDTYWWRLSGGYGSFGIAVLNNAYEESRGTDDEDLVDSMLSDLAGLAQYPYLQGAEDEESEIQMNTESEQWSEYGAAEFRGLLAPVLGEWIETIDDEILYWLYRGLSDAFNVNVDFEGSGDNIAAVWHFDMLVNRFAEILSAWEPVDGSENPLRVAIVEHLNETLHAPEGSRHTRMQAFDYGGAFGNIFRFTRDFVRDAGSVLVFRDWIEEHGAERALAHAQKKGAKVEALGGLDRRSLRRRA